MKLSHWLIAGGCGILLGACSQQQLYATGQQAQRTQCLQSAAQEQQEECMRKANMPFEDYQRMRDSAH